MAHKLFDAVNPSLIEREREFMAVMLGIFSRQHVWIKGMPGLAKSALDRAFEQAIEGWVYFERSLSGDTTLDDIMGPINVTEYAAGRLVRVDGNYFPKAHFAFLDEFPRGNEVLLDALLHGLGPERQMPVDGRQVKLRLHCCVTATNSYPEGAHLAAIFDRFLIRTAANRVSAAAQRDLCFATLPSVQPAMTLAEVEAGQQAAAAMPISKATESVYLKILESLAVEGIVPSDRRKRAAVGVARAAAYLDGASEVLSQHFECLADVLWDDPSQADKAGEVICRIANPMGARLNELIREVDEVVTGATASDTQLSALKKLENSLTEARKMISSGNGRAQKCVDYITREKLRVATRLTGGDEQVAMAMMPKV